MPKTSMDRRITDLAVRTPDVLALAAAVDEQGGAAVLLTESLARLRECITRPQGRNGPAVAVQAVRVMVDIIARALGAQATGHSEGGGAPLVSLTLVQAARPPLATAEVIDMEAGQNTDSAPGL